VNKTSRNKSLHSKKDERGSLLRTQYQTNIHSQPNTVVNTQQNSLNVTQIENYTKINLNKPILSKAKTRRMEFDETLINQQNLNCKKFI
jgi:hypothetical protein